VKLGEFRTSKYLAKEDVSEQGRNLTIAAFDAVTFDDGKRKPVVAWTDPAVKPMIVNALNARRLEQMFRTDNTDRMLGQVVNVYRDTMVEMQGKIVGGLRLRPAAALPASALVPPTPDQVPAPRHPQDRPPDPAELAAALELLRRRAAAATAASNKVAADFDDEVPF